MFVFEEFSWVSVRNLKLCSTFHRSMAGRKRLFPVLFEWSRWPCCGEYSFKIAFTSFNLWLVNRAYRKNTKVIRRSLSHSVLPNLGHSRFHFSTHCSECLLHRSGQWQLLYNTPLYLRKINTCFYRLLYTKFYRSASLPKKKGGGRKGSIEPEYLFKSQHIWIDFKCYFCP